ncbi:MAG: hypothetical protein HRT47_03250 [Candidatus Caenarcaniphilales bacterium]|nr:hypothetical protein [Candidatus Caenarcaniphilales bacterium]
MAEFVNPNIPRDPNEFPLIFYTQAVSGQRSPTKKQANQDKGVQPKQNPFAERGQTPLSKVAELIQKAKKIDNLGLPLSIEVTNKNGQPITFSSAMTNQNNLLGQIDLTTNRNLNEQEFYHLKSFEELSEQIPDSKEWIGAKTEEKGSEFLSKADDIFDAMRNPQLIHPRLDEAVTDLVREFMESAQFFGAFKESAPEGEINLSFTGKNFPKRKREGLPDTELLNLEVNIKKNNNDTQTLIFKNSDLGQIKLIVPNLSQDDRSDLMEAVLTKFGTMG